MQGIFAHTALLPEGWRDNVLVKIDDNGRIAAVTTGSDRGDATPVPVLLPAISNLHSHTFQRAMAGLAERRSQGGHDSFWSWREVMYRFLDLLSPEDIEAIAAFAFMEMQEAGFCAAAEFHYLHRQPGGAPYDDPAELCARIAAAAAETGIGLTLLPVLYRHGGVDRRPLQGGQLRFGNDLAAFERVLARAEAHMARLPSDKVLGAAAHSLRAAGIDDIRAASAVLQGTPFHMHIAEQEPEIEEVLAAHGARPVEYLLNEATLDQRWCLVHATHMNAVETERLARSGAVAGLCPLTEANLGDGIFNGPALRQAGGRYGIGSDSNIRISVVEELRQLEYSQRLKHRARALMADEGASCGRALYETALAGGAQALGRETGAIERGRWADLVAVDPAPLAGAAPSDTILDCWIFAGGNNQVTDLWSAGRHMVRGGTHVARERITARYQAVASRLAEAL